MTRRRADRPRSRRPQTKPVAQQAADWLNGLGPDKVRDAVAVKLTFRVPKKDSPGKETVFYGARYTSVGHYTADMQGVRDGRFKAGDEYTDQRFYVLGVIPKFPQKRGPGGMSETKHVYVIAGDEADWYPGGGYVSEGTKLSPEDEKRYHPFGSNWAFHRWPHEKIGQQIDHYDGVKRERISLVVENL